MIFLTAEWRDLVTLNWEVAPELLAPYVPRGTELDRHDGRVYVSLVAFRFVNTRVLRLAIPRHVDFEEVNLRFYVRRQAGDEVRRGVVFIQEIAPRACVVLVAPPAVQRELRAHDDVARGRGAATAPRARLTAGGWATPIARWRSWPTLQWPRCGTAGTRSSSLSTIGATAAGTTGGRSNIAWRIHGARMATAHEFSFACDVAAVYGARFAAALASPPVSAFIADGSEVTVASGRTLGH